MIVFGILIIIWGAVTYRVSRFVVLDSMWEGTRDKIFDRLERSDRLVAAKASDWLACPWCVTPWAAAAVLASHRIFAGSFPLPVWAWLATATIALVFWARIDAD